MLEEAAFCDEQDGLDALGVVAVEQMHLEVVELGGHLGADDGVP